MSVPTLSLANLKKNFLEYLLHLSILSMNVANLTLSALPLCPSRLAAAKIRFWQLPRRAPPHFFCIFSPTRCKPMRKNFSCPAFFAGITAQQPLFTRKSAPKTPRKKTVFGAFSQILQKNRITPAPRSCFKSSPKVIFLTCFHHLHSTSSFYRCAPVLRQRILHSHRHCCFNTFPLTLYDKYARETIEAKQNHTCVFIHI